MLFVQLVQCVFGCHFSHIVCIINSFLHTAVRAHFGPKIVLACQTKSKQNKETQVLKILNLI